MLYLTRLYTRKDENMPSENAKEIKCVITFLSVLSIVVLGSFIVDRNIADLLYLIFIIICLIRFLLLVKNG